jgi:hypothetical protein
MTALYLHAQILSMKLGFPRFVLDSAKPHPLGCADVSNSARVWIYPTFGFRFASAKREMISRVLLVVPCNRGFVCDGVGACSLCYRIAPQLKSKARPAHSINPKYHRLSSC